MSALTMTHAMPYPAIYKTPESCKWDALGHEWILPSEAEFAHVRARIGARYPTLCLDRIGSPDCAVGRVDCFNTEQVDYAVKVFREHILPGAQVIVIKSVVGERIETIDLGEPPEDLLALLEDTRCQNAGLKARHRSRTQEMVQNRAKILLLIRRAGKATAITVQRSTRTNWSIKTIRWHLSHLKMLGLIKPRRQGRDYFWHITTTGEDFLRAIK